jgi:hypothetical protein
MLMTNRMLIHTWAAFSAEALPHTRGPPPANASYDGDRRRAGDQNRTRTSSKEIDGLQRMRLSHAHLSFGREDWQSHHQEGTSVI